MTLHMNTLKKLASKYMRVVLHMTYYMAMLRQLTQMGSPMKVSGTMARSVEEESLEDMTMRSQAYSKKTFW